jgi:electron transfer DM13
MTTKRFLVVGGAVVALGIAWAVFRPELLFVNQHVNEAALATTSGGGAPMLTGRFRGVAHETKGTATISKSATGQRVLRLTGFETSNGPDVRVLLAAVPDATDNDTVKKASPVELGKLKGNIGDQNYEVPADLDLSKYRSVVIWCNRFGVNFGTAPLQAS